jgi:TrmH family RNA methyltransferase
VATDIRISARTAEFQLLAALLENRKQRRKQGRFLVQGVTPINLALANGWAVDSLVVASGRPRSRWAEQVLRDAGARTHVELLPELFAELSGKEEPGELLAVLDLPPDGLERIPAVGAPLLVVCDRPGSPGNLGSILRSADAFGADATVVTGHAVDIYDPQTIRASVGTVFARPAVHADSPTELVAWLRARWPALRLVGTSARAEHPLRDADLTGPVALVLGNEASGLSEAWRGLCELVAIPIRGAASSLNLAAAAAVVLAEADRQRYG